MLCALQHVSEKQEKSKDRLVRDLKKKKVPQKQRKTLNRGILESEPRKKIQC